MHSFLPGESSVDAKAPEVSKLGKYAGVLQGMPSSANLKAFDNAGKVLAHKIGH